MGIVDSLNRLQRAGSKSSKTTQKLMEAAAEAADEIVQAVPEWAVDKSLPKNYRVIRRRSNVGSAKFLVLEGGRDEWDNPIEEYIDGTGTYLHGDFHCWIPEQTREGVLLFAKALANGLLDEIAEWLEQHSSEDENLTQTIEGE